MSVSQALAEALTTSAKGMVGRRLLQCSDLSRTIDIPDPGDLNPFRRLLFSLPSRDAFGRELLTIGFEDQCNSIVNTFKATWDAAKKTAVDAVETTARAAAATVTTLLNEAKAAAAAAAATATKSLNEAKAATQAVENAANVAAAAATSTLNEVMDAAEKAAATATEFIDVVGNAFSELGKEIQCAAPLPPPAPL